jgi:glutamine amidotransferase
LTFQGWSKVFFKEDIMKQSLGQKDFYFSHSYYMNVENEKHILAKSENYKIEFASCIVNNNVLGAQFHPERSGKVGLSFLQYSLDWAKNNG